MSSLHRDDDQATVTTVIRTPIAVAVVRAVRLLGNLRVLHPDVGSGALERTLRQELARLLDSRAPGAVEHPSVAAVRAACAHLGVRAYEEAYLALITAEGRLPRRSAAGPA